ncbi:MAG: GIY-YIG nuclease family protein [Bacteroidota bacterium]
MYFVYILFSPKTNKYYVGSTDNLESRLKHHNAG